MRLLLLFLLPLLDAAVNLPVDPKTDDKLIAEGQCRENDITSLDNDKTTAECWIDMSKRFVINIGTDQLQPTISGLCKSRVYTCKYASGNTEEICEGKVEVVQQATVTLEAEHAVFTDSSNCQMFVNQGFDKIAIHNRFQQSKHFKEYKIAMKDDRPADASQTIATEEGLYVASVANYLERDDDLPSSTYKDGVQHNMIFGDTFTWGGNPKYACGHGCKYGAHLVFDQVKANQLFTIKMYPNIAKCQWIAICFKHEDECKEKDRIMFLLKLNIVLPHTYNSAISIPLHDAQMIQVDRPQSREDKFYITTDNNDRIVLDAINTAHISILMSHHDCLAAPLFTNLGEGHAVAIKTNEKDRDGVDRNNPETKTPDDTEFKQLASANSANGKKSDLSGVAQNNMTEITASTTQAPQNLNASEEATTKEIEMITVEQGLSSMDSNRPRGTGEGDEASNKIGWKTYAYFWGALAGSTTGFIICGIFFYLCRRSIYQNWYRGVYKRYGCDASGTTGGATGADFGATTGGGQTTIGAETAGASTMGTTGTTGGSTSSAMSTVDDKTGTSMITM